jgi:DNA-binding CsgD family transcriptional regulator
MSEALNCECFGVVIRKHAVGDIVGIISAGISSSDLRRLQAYEDSDPTGGYVLCDPGRFVTPEKLGEAGAYERTAYYREWAAPLGFDHCAASIVSIAPERVAAFGIHRRRRWGAFSEAELELLETVAPHFSRAILISEQRARAASLSARLIDALAGRGSYAAVVTRRCEVRRAAAGFQDVVERHPGLVQRGGRLCAASRSNHDALASLVRGACDSDVGGVLRLSGCEVEVVALENGLTRSSAECMVVLTPDVSDSRVSPEAIRATFGLTVAESEVAAGLADGSSPQEIAEERGVAVGTVRVQLKRVFEKLGVRRQAEAVRLLAGLVRG